MELKKVVEALLFASQKPLSIKEIATVLKAALEASPDDAAALALSRATAADIGRAVDTLASEYDASGAAFQLVETATGWHVVTRADYAAWVRQLFPENRPARLTAPSLETLAIIAYRQPITRADLEAVRGVSVDGVMQTLLDRGLVRIAGRADMPGRPLLYETTSGFLDHFGLRSLDELPNADELRRVELPVARTDGDGGAATTDGQTEMSLPAADGGGEEPAVAGEGGADEAAADGDGGGGGGGGGVAVGGDSVAEGSSGEEVRDES